MAAPTLAFTDPGRQPNTSLVPAAKPAAAAGTTLVAAARVGRIVGRSYLRLARQLPGVAALEREAGKVTRALADRAGELIDDLIDQAAPHLPATGSATDHDASPTASPAAVYASPDEARVVRDAHAAEPGVEPLRAAMNDLLNRSTELTSSRQYLFGSIVSQLVPDEARLLATLADGGPFAVTDLVGKPTGRGARRTERTVLTNASTLGSAAGLCAPGDTGAYLTRLFRFGLIDFGPADARLDAQYDLIAADESVVRARAAAEADRQGAVRHRRKTVLLSEFGREFWTATAPAHPTR